MWEGVREEERLVNSGSMVYQARSERLYPLRRVVLSVDSGNIEGTDESTHCVGVRMLILSVDDSKSSR